MSGKKEKIAFVCQRYGEQVNGGSELLCRQLAEKIQAIYHVEVFTTCAEDLFTWRNFYKPGIETINGVTVRRYIVEKERDMAQFNQLSGKIFASGTEKKSDEMEERWIKAQGPVCHALLEDLKQTHKEYKAVIFVCCLYYLSVKGLQLGFDNAYLLPTLHDELPIYLRQYDKEFGLAKGFIWNTTAERAFAYKRFPQSRHVPGVVAGAGIDVPEGPLPALPKELEGVPYLVYAGRIDPSKGCDKMLQYFMDYKKAYPGKLKLVLMGKTSLKLPDHPDIIYLGFVSDELKFSVMGGAQALVLFSEFESLSLVVLESMAMGRPVLVNGGCEVLRRHCVDSNAGLYFTDYRGFEMALNYLLSHPGEYEVMRENAERYVRDNYRWESILQRIDALISQKPLNDERSYNAGEEQGETVDVENTLRQIAAEAGQLPDCDIPHFKQLLGTKIKVNVPAVVCTSTQGESEMSLSEEIAYLREHAQVLAYRRIYSCRAVIGALIVFVKRVIRKLTKFYVEPIALDQSDVNTHMLHAIELMSDKLAEQEQEIEWLKELLEAK